MESPLRPSDDPDFRLIETFGFHSDDGFVRLELHLARMAASAEALDIRFEREHALDVLNGVSADQAQRCRLTMDLTGAFSLETAPMPALAEVWKFRIHPTSLISSDPWLRHKSTRRALYNEARADLPEGVDEFVFLNERGEVCEGTITNVFLTRADGRVQSPPLASGCLRGVYRHELLQAGRAQEAIVTLRDLENAQSITLTNSLRGAIPAVWDPADPARP